MEIIYLIKLIFVKSVNSLIFKLNFNSFQNLKMESKKRRNSYTCVKKLEIVQYTKIHDNRE